MITLYKRTLDLATLGLGKRVVVHRWCIYCWWCSVSLTLHPLYQRGVDVLLMIGLAAWICLSGVIGAADVVAVTWEVVSVSVRVALSILQRVTPVRSFLCGSTRNFPYHCRWICAHVDVIVVFEERAAQLAC
ncbi:hypothetical protein L1987_22227 [Smallanthus sonchifolius]|uniref:Uncharacterized protein n=1 Tax=Smallanthus sonchifolius TaxID=185202 RepID=A0ACB9IFM3_9ASTR|nr:hypothetical protein L1987_22227 [Smallanthus sonchifolius]